LTVNKPSRLCQPFAVAKKLDAAAAPPDFGRRAAEVDVDAEGVYAPELLHGACQVFVAGEAELVHDRAFAISFFCKGRDRRVFVAHGAGRKHFGG
jgi:hypothetical protein